MPMVRLISFPPLREDDTRHEAPFTTVNIDGTDYGTGRLYIAKRYGDCSCVAWLKDGEGKGIKLEYPKIICHAISRDLNAFPHECIYLMVEGKLPEEDSADDNEDDDDEDGEDDDDEGVITEIRLIPDPRRPPFLDLMYVSLSDCQALHPDPEDVDSDYEDALAECKKLRSKTSEGVIKMPPFYGLISPEDSVPRTEANLAHFSDMQLGQGDGPSTSNGATSAVSPSGDAGQDSDEEPMDVAQFQDAEDME